MEIKHDHIRDALINWSVADSQRNVTLQITRAYFALGISAPVLQRIEREDQTVDYSAWHNNQQSILQRWSYGDTPAARKKISQLLPAILAAMPPEMRASLIAGNSVQFLAMQALKENQEAITAALLNANLTDFIRECDEAERAFRTFRLGVQELLN
ncbi:toxin YdaT family protein [Rahnella aceris]|uniref:toxin YdaT family protein n=1 Tax=Rahnella sp. (strain Y9602) TaxID=2703885 RepID=UPI001C252184|nr:toxin YdaT family protein [Rahnella aceris]MBU9866786.1 hypothetical protein [Rahnella aceris]